MEVRTSGEQDKEEVLCLHSLAPQIRQGIRMVITDRSCWGRVAALGLDLRHRSPPSEGKGDLVDVDTGGEVSDVAQVAKALIKVHFKTKVSKK